MDPFLKEMSDENNKEDGDKEKKVGIGHGICLNGNERNQLLTCALDCGVCHAPIGR